MFYEIQEIKENTPSKIFKNQQNKKEVSSQSLLFFVITKMGVL